MKSTVITLDGPAGSGKSSVAKELARRLGMLHADSGGIYRTFTLALMRRLGPCPSHEAFGEALSQSSISPESLEVSILTDGTHQYNLIRGQDQADEIRSPDVTSRIRYVADRPVFREAVNALLRGMTNVVADGRDMGSVVFPNASYKYYLEASVDIRAARRAAENEARGWKEDLGAIKESIRKRDEEDEKREYGALIRTPDMILIDTGPLNLEGVIGRILNSLQIKF